MTELRYTAQRVGSTAWLHYDLALETDGPRHTFSSYETFTAKISPEMYARLADDGKPMLQKWGTWIHVETPDERVFTGIVDDVWAEGATQHIRVVEWIGYLDGLVLTSRLWGVDADPANLVRDLITHVQSFQPGFFPVTVTGSTSTRVGSASEDKMIAAKATMDAKRTQWDSFAKPRKALEAEVKKISAPHDAAIKALNLQRRILADGYAMKVASKASAAVVAAAKAAADSKAAQIKSRRATKDAAIGTRKTRIEQLKATEAPVKDSYDAAKTVYDDAKSKVKDDGGAWKALPEDTPDCWKVLKDLAAEGAGFHFTAQTERTTGAPKLTLAIQTAIPGRVRDDLVFEQGRTIVIQPKVQDPEEYASEVIALGAGEGGAEGKALRQDIAVTDSRLRRTVVYSDPAITTQARLSQVGRAELARLRDPYDIPELVVRDDPNCPIGAWAPGDIITVRMHRVPHYGALKVKRRIRAWQRIGTTKARLYLEAPDG